jgi:activator of 2-hydroxyglutaryl-CoA dehydratase
VWGIAWWDEIRLDILVPEEPQITGALGAAVLAQTELGKLGKAKG